MTQPHFITVTWFRPHCHVAPKAFQVSYPDEVAITIQLSQDVETRLLDQAREAGLPVDAYVQRLINNQASQRGIMPEPEADLSERLMPILRKLDALPRLDTLPIDDIIGYDDIGLPLR